MITSRRGLAVIAVSFVMSGCAMEQGDPEPTTGAADDALMTANTMTANTMTANTMTANTMTANSLISSTLTGAGIAGRVLTSLQDTTAMGANNRTLFHYIVTCALQPSQSVTYTWADANGTYTVTETGQIGLATSWATGPLKEREQQLVSGCLAARTNYFGVTVQISVRNQILAPTTGSDELAAYPHVEGAFWGNLFTANPHLHACYDPKNVANSRADQRDCATGYPEGNGQLASCGIITLTGSCDEQCFGLDPHGQFYRYCGNDDTMNAITVGLE